MQEHQQPTALEDRLPQWNSFFWMCPWFLHVSVTVAGATAFKWLGKCLRAANLLCSTFNCLPCLCNCVSTFLLLPVLSQTRLKACLSSWVNLSLVYCWHWGRMGKIELCCFGEGCVSSDHMQIASAHTEFLLRTENTPRKIPPPHRTPRAAFLLSATVLAVELTVQHRSVMQVGDISMEFSFPLHTWRECGSVSALTLILFAPLTSSIFAPYTWTHPVFFQPFTWKLWARDEILSSNCLGNQSAWILA